MQGGKFTRTSGLNSLQNKNCPSYKTKPEGQYPNKQGLIKQKLGIDERNIHNARYEFFNAASLLALAAYNNTPDVMLTWTDSGRNIRNIHTVGLLILDFPIAVRLEGMTLGELFGSVHEQMKSCRLHSDYPYTSTLDDELLCSIYQGRLTETPGKIKIFDGEIPIRWNNPYSDNILDVEIYDFDGEFELHMDYSAHRYRRESMERFAGIYTRIVHKMIEADNEMEALKLCL